MAASDVVALRAEYCGDGKCLITIQSNDGEVGNTNRMRILTNILQTERVHTCVI